MAAYGQSFGSDSYDPGDYDDSWDENWDGSPMRSDPFDDAEWAESWEYLAEENTKKRPIVRWDHMSHAWHCTCNNFAARGNCFHVYRFRPEQIVKVDERYL